MRDEMKIGDKVFIYHSNADPPAIAGVGIVVREAYADPSSWDAKSKYFDPKSTPKSPRWYMVDIQLDEKFEAPLSLETLRGVTALKKMELLRRGSRLSVQPVSAEEFAAIMKLGSAS